MKVSFLLQEYPASNAEVCERQRGNRNTSLRASTKQPQLHDRDMYVRNTLPGK